LTVNGVDAREVLVIVFVGAVMSMIESVDDTVSANRSVLAIFPAIGLVGAVDLEDECVTAHEAGIRQHVNFGVTRVNKGRTCITR
jgi:hypothetical protein